MRSISGLRGLPKPALALAVHLAVVIIPILFYFYMVSTTAPFPFRQVGIAARYNFLKTGVILLICVYSVFCLRGWVGSTASLAVVMGLFGLSLVGLWSSGETTSTIISGLLPWADASKYYQDALRLLEGGSFQAFSAWRPLFSGLLSGILAITGRNLQITLGLLTGMVAIACFLLAREVQRKHGPLTAAFVVLVLFFYYRQRVSGMVLSEQLGLTLGMLGFAVLWRGGASHAWKRVLFGIFLVSLALNARPGAFFVLPGLALWASWNLGNGRKFSWLALFSAGVVIIVGFAVNSFVRALVSSEPSLPFANFAYALYGLVTGGRQYASALADHPELSQLTGNAHFLRVYVLSFEEFLRHPAGLLVGMLKYWGQFFSFNWYSAYGYMISETAVITVGTRALMYALCLVGLVRCLRTRNDPHHQLVLSAFIGLLLSVPFVPPGDAYAVRLYAATMPIVAILPALGVNTLFSPLEKQFRWLHNDQTLEREYSVGFAALLVTLVILSPVLVKAFARPADALLVDCQAGSEAVTVRFAPGSSVNILKESVFFLDRLPNFHSGRFQKQIHGLPADRQMKAFAGLESPFTIYETVDLVTLRPVWLLLDPLILHSPGEVQGICGVWNNDPDLEEYGFFDAREGAAGEPK